MDIEHSAKATIEAPPDADGWKIAVERDELAHYCVQDIVRAARAINISGDRTVFTAILKHISDQIINVLRAYVGTNHRNGGQDIIDDVHQEMICAVLDPNSKDGAALCEAFVRRIQFRAQDAIEREALNCGRYTSADGMPDAVFVDETRNLSDQEQEELLVGQILDQIPDSSKRLAFRLHMEQIPYDSGRGLPSIAKAVGKSEKTVRDWIKEIKAQLSAKLGENS